VHITVLGTGLAILPESPRWLIMKGRDEKAQRALARVLGQPIDSPQVHEEYAEIASNLHHERAIGATSYLDCFRNGAGRNALRMWTGIWLQALQQLSGIVSPVQRPLHLRTLISDLRTQNFIFCQSQIVSRTVGNLLTYLL
jgi:hypothetical protein